MKRPCPAVPGGPCRGEGKVLFSDGVQIRVVCGGGFGVVKCSYTFLIGDGILTVQAKQRVETLLSGIQIWCTIFVVVNGWLSDVQVRFSGGECIKLGV